MITIKLMVTLKIFATDIDAASPAFDTLCITTLKIGRCNFAWFSFCRESNFFCCLEPLFFHHPLELRK